MPFPIKTPHERPDTTPITPSKPAAGAWETLVRLWNAMRQAFDDLTALDRKLDALKEYVNTELAKLRDFINDKLSELRMYIDRELAKLKSFVESKVSELLQRIVQTDSKLDREVSRLETLIRENAGKTEQVDKKPPATPDYDNIVNLGISGFAWGSPSNGYPEWGTNDYCKIIDLRQACRDKAGEVIIKGLMRGVPEDGAPVPPITTALGAAENFSVAPHTPYCILLDRATKRAIWTTSSQTFSSENGISSTITVEANALLLVGFRYGGRPRSVIVEQCAFVPLVSKPII